RIADSRGRQSQIVRPLIVDAHRHGGRGALLTALEIDDAWNLGEPSHELLRQLGELGVVWPKNGDHDRLPADRCREARHAVDPLANLSLDLFLRRSRTQLAIRQSNQKPSVVAAVSRPNSGDDS